MFDRKWETRRIDFTHRLIKGTWKTEASHAVLLLLRKKEAGHVFLFSFTKNDACLVRLQFSSFMLFVVGDQLFAGQIIKECAVLFLIGEVAGNGQYLPCQEGDCKHKWFRCPQEAPGTFHRR